MSLKGRTRKVCVYITEHHSAYKKEDILIHATTRVNLENIPLSEKSQSRKDRYRVIPLVRNLEQIHRDRKWKRGGQGLAGRRESELVFKGEESFSSARGRVQEVDGGDSHTAA